MDLKALVKNYWVSLLLIIFGGILQYLSFNNAGISLWQIGILVAIVGVLQAIDKRASNKEFSNIKTQYAIDMGELKKSGEEQKKATEQQKKISEEQTRLIEEVSERQKIRANLVARLVDHGLISQTDIIKHLEGMDAFILYCYSNPPPVSNKIKIIRQYPSFLNKFGFVRMGKRSTLFITTTNRLTKRLQNPNALKQWLLRELKEVLKAEWKTQLEKMTEKQKGFLYKRYGQGDYSNFLNMDILIFKTRLSGGNIGIINKNILPADFTKLLGRNIKLEKIELEENKKIEVKKFVFESSFQLFFSEIPQEDLNKLLALEAKLKQQLNISNFMEYGEKSSEDIKNVFKSSLDEPKALEYANLLKTKAKEYEEALKEMGISTT